VPHNVISALGSPVPLLKFQMAPTVKVKNELSYNSTPSTYVRGVDRDMLFLLSPITELKGRNKCIFGQTAAMNLAAASRKMGKKWLIS